MFNLKFRVNAHRTNLEGIKNAPKILSRNMRQALYGLGKRLVKSSQSRMREDTREAKRSLTISVTGSNLDLALLVFSTKVQAIIDAIGLPRGVFPPYREGSRLYRWASRKVRGQESPRVRRFKVPKRSLYQLNKNFERRARLRKIDRVKKVSAPRTTGNKRVRARNANAKRVAFLIARSIYRRGIRATHWNTKALEANKNQIIKGITNALHRSIIEMSRR